MEKLNERKTNAMENKWGRGWIEKSHGSKSEEQKRKESVGAEADGLLGVGEGKSFFGGGGGKSDKPKGARRKGRCFSTVAPKCHAKIVIFFSF